MTIVPSLEASSTTTTTRRKRLLSFRFLVLLFLTGIDYLPPSLTYNTASFSSISSSLASRSTTVLPLGIGVLADVVLISTLVEVTETVPPPPVTTASDENVPVVATNTAVATEPPAADTGADTVVAPVTASGADSSQPTATGVGEAKVEVPATAIATYAEAGAAETGTVVSAAAATTDPGTNPASTGLKDANTAPASTHTTAPSGITTSTRRISSPTTGTSTPSPTATDSPQQSFPTYATALASGTAIIAAAGIGTAFFIFKRRRRLHRRGGGDGGQQPPTNKIDCSSIRKIDIINKPKTKSRGDDLTSWEQPENINEQTNWDRERTPPDPDELRKRMQEEKNTAWRNSKEGSEPIDLGISYAPAAAASTTSFSSRHNNPSPEEQNGGGTPLQQQQQQQQEQRYTHEDPSSISMPDELLPVMLPLNIQPHHQPDGQPLPPPPPPPTVETINRQDTISPSIYSRDSIGTNFADFYTRINSGSNENHHRNGNNSSYHTNLHTIPDDPREALFQTDRYGFQDENHHDQPQYQSNFEDRSLRSEDSSHGNEAWGGRVPAHRPGFGYNPYDEGFDAA